MSTGWWVLILWLSHTFTFVIGFVVCSIMAMSKKSDQESGYE